MMTKLTFSILIVFFGAPAMAAFHNYNSVMIGSRAAGMGGAFTALTGDPAAVSYYNPASLARMEGSSLSAAVNLYNKYETLYGDQQDFSAAPLRVNQGSIIPVPAASGNVYTFRNFGLGLSIVTPDFDNYIGVVESDANSSSFLNTNDSSLWVGGNLALNLTNKTSAGLTIYYTSRTFSRSVTDQSTSGPETIITNEEKIVKSNSLVYSLGLFHQLSPNWSTGFSLRLPSLPVSGNADYYRSSVSTVSGVTTPISFEKIRAQTLLPGKISWGLGYEEKRKIAMGFDLSYYSGLSYDDTEEALASDTIEFRETWNINAGMEYYFEPWISLRGGFFTNLSSQNDIPTNPTRRYGDKIDMMGFTANLGLHTSEQTTVTLGGYYNGGRGHASQQVGQQIKKVEKSVQTFSFLVGTSFNF